MNPGIKVPEGIFISISRIISYNWNPVSKEPVIQIDKNSIFVCFKLGKTHGLGTPKKKIHIGTMDAAGGQIDVCFISISRMILYNWNPVSKESVIQIDKNSIFAFSKPWSKVWTYYEKKLQVRTMNAEGRQIIVFFRSQG